MLFYEKLLITNNDFFKIFLILMKQNNVLKILFI